MPAVAPARRQRDRRSFLLQRAQPAMAGLIDGSLSTLAPIFAVAFATHQPHDAFLAGLATASGRGTSRGGMSCCPAISMRNARSGWRTIRRWRALTLISCGRGPRGGAEIPVRRAD